MIDDGLLSDLTAQAEISGVEQIVIGAIIQVDGKSLLLRPEDDFMGGIYELSSGKSKQANVEGFALAGQKVVLTFGT